MPYTLYPNPKVDRLYKDEVLAKLETFKEDFDVVQVRARACVCVHECVSV